MKTKILALPLLAVTLSLAACGSSPGTATRDSIRAVGSSTVYPFAKKVAELFTRSTPNVQSPIIESTGSGGGMKLFCAGIGAETPDITHASRRMKLSEFEDCQRNGVTDVVEIQIGLDGLALASADNGITMSLTPALVYRALAAKPFGKEQTAKTWSDVDPSLPAEPILVYGPPSTSGTRDSFEELILLEGCESDSTMVELKETNEEEYDRICTDIRSDGAYVDQGEQDNLIVQKIEANPKAVGVFGYSYLEENADKLQGLSMNGVEPTYETISDLTYPGAREMFIYVKKAHLDAIPGLKDFLAQWVSSWGPGGPLAQIGLVVSPAEVRERNTTAATEYTVLTADELK